MLQSLGRSRAHFVKCHPVRAVSTAGPSKWDEFKHTQVKFRQQIEQNMNEERERSMFEEMRELNRTHGKLFHATTHLIEEKAAAKVPSLEAKILTPEEENEREVDVTEMLHGEKGAPKVTVLFTSFRNFGLEMLPSWYHPFQTKFANHPQVQFISLNIIEQWYMRFFNSMVVKGIRQAIPEAERVLSLVHFGRSKEFRSALKMNNSFVGYVHLIDSEARVRWSATGNATPEELQSLTKLTQKLLPRAASKK